MSEIIIGVPNDAVLKNIRFGIARALTQTAKQTAEAITSELPAIFDRPNPFTMRAIGFTPATRDNLEAVVFVRDAQAAYLGIQETGGTRTPKPGSPINIPVRQRLNRFGNIARGAIAREREKGDTFVARPGQNRTKHLAPGLYRRSEIRGRRKDGSYGGKMEVRQGGKGKALGGKAAKGGTTLKLLVAFKKQAAYAPRFDFRKRASAEIAATLPKALEASVASALATMR